MKWSSVLGATMIAVCGAGSAAAHHSAAMFDGQKSQSLHGTVKAFQWTNPHSWIQLVVDADGKSIEWSIEMGSPQGLYRSGWRPGTLRAGQEITVVVRPERNGAPIGLFVSATQRDGSPVVKVKP